MKISFGDMLNAISKFVKGVEIQLIKTYQKYISAVIWKKVYLLSFVL